MKASKCTWYIVAFTCISKYGPGNLLKINTVFSRANAPLKVSTCAQHILAFTGDNYSGEFGLKDENLFGVYRKHGTCKLKLFF